MGPSLRLFCIVANVVRLALPPCNLTVVLKSFDEEPTGYIFIAVISITDEIYHQYLATRPTFCLNVISREKS